VCLAGVFWLVVDSKVAGAQAGGQAANSSSSSRQTAWVFLQRTRGKKSRLFSFCHSSLLFHFIIRKKVPYKVGKRFECLKIENRARVKKFQTWAAREKLGVRCEKSAPPRENSTCQLAVSYSHVRPILFCVGQEFEGSRRRRLTAAKSFLCKMRVPMNFGTLPF
jgi:hypothetical protein